MTGEVSDQQAEQTEKDIEKTELMKINEEILLWVAFTGSYNWR